MPLAKELPTQAKHCQTVVVAAASEAMALDWLANEITLQQTHHPQRKLAVIWDGDLQTSSLNRLSGVAVQTLLAGCVCCVGGPVLKSAVVKVLRMTAPDRLWIIGGPSALLSAMAQAVQSPLLAIHATVEQMVWLAQPGSLKNFEFDQIECANTAVNTDLLTIEAPTHPWALVYGDKDPVNSVSQNGAAYVEYFWPVDALFDRKMVQSTFKSISEVTTINGRLDGLFRTQRTHYYGASHGTNVIWRHTSWRIDSRIRLTGVDAQRIVVTLQTLREQFESCRTR